IGTLGGVRGITRCLPERTVGLWSASTSWLQRVWARPRSRRPCCRVACRAASWSTGRARGRRLCGRRAGLLRSAPNAGSGAPFLASGPAPVALTRLVDARAEAGVGDQLCRPAEAADVCDLGADRVSEDPGDAGHSDELPQVGM